jgi:hypothetical protein
VEVAAPVETPAPVEVAAPVEEPAPVEVAAPVEEPAPVQMPAAPTMKAAGDIPADEVEVPVAAAVEEDATYTVRQKGHRPGPNDMGRAFEEVQALFDAGDFDDMGTFEVMASSNPGKWLHPAMLGFEAGAVK